MLGKREPTIYGSQTLNDIIDDLSQTANAVDIKIEHLQANAEHLLIERIHSAYQAVDFIIIIINNIGGSYVCVSRQTISNYFLIF